MILRRLPRAFRLGAEHLIEATHNGRRTERAHETITLMD